MHLRTIIHRAALAAVLLLACGATLLAEYKYTEEFNRTLPLTADGRLSIKNVNGDIEVTAWDRNEVQVDAVKGADSREYLDAMTIVVRSEDDSIEIRTQHPSRKSGNRRGGGSVQFRVQVPRGATLDAVETVNGRVSVEGTTGSARVKTVNGKVDWRGSGQDVDLSTVNGRIEADFDRLTGGSVTVSSVNGAVNVGLPADASASVKASAVHGGIDSDFSAQVRAGGFWPGRKIEFDIGGGGTRMELKTVNGGIKIQRR